MSSIEARRLSAGWGSTGHRQIQDAVGHWSMMTRYTSLAVHERGTAAVSHAAPAQSDFKFVGEMAISVARKVTQFRAV